jgi:hypothetical protein
MSCLFVLLGLSACGFEGFLGRMMGDDHPRPDAGNIEEPQPAVVTGSIPGTSIPELDARDIQFLTGDDVTLTPTLTISGEGFEAGFPPGERLVGLMVVARRNTVALRALVPEAVPGETRQAGDFDGIDNLETAACLLLQAKASVAGRSLSSYPADTLQAALDEVSGLASSGEVKTFFDMVQAITACTGCNRGSTPRFRSPVFTAGGHAIQSGLHPDFILDNQIDYDGDGEVENTTEKFDEALAAALDAFDFRACYCDQEETYAACGYDRPMIRVVITADFNEGTKDGNCEPIDRFLWTDNQEGARMFIAAGLHPESPIQDDAIEQTLGAWVPNQVPMYDDGTHGDDRAGDGVWTVSWDLPVGLRFGYKFTWGRTGDNWGGTEEWPGNRRILEVVDVDSDHLVARHDAFGDQTSNKDLANQLYPANGGNGSVDFVTDANSDGVPDARERMVDTDGDCALDSWRTPTGVLPLTTPCQ